MLGHSTALPKAKAGWNMPAAIYLCLDPLLIYPSHHSAFKLGVVECEVVGVWLGLRIRIRIRIHIRIHNN